METLMQQIEQRLGEIIQPYPPGLVKDAMLYSLQAGGKRIRPIFVLEVIRSYDTAYREYLDIACAVEMVHTYSLIHDDLPAMDNDDLRRGKPTCHKQFDEATAILAGDSLLNEAMNVILHSTIDDAKKIKALQILFNASGINGMIYGQQLDLEAEKTNISLEQLDVLHANKTGALISAALELGALFVNEADCPVWRSIGHTIGLAFQIQDDVLDVIGDTATLGKQVGSDATNHKTTYVTALGLEASIVKANQLFDEAIAKLYGLRINHGLLLGRIEALRKRVK